MKKYTVIMQVSEEKNAVVLDCNSIELEVDCLKIHDIVCYQLLVRQETGRTDSFQESEIGSIIIRNNFAARIAAEVSADGNQRALVRMSSSVELKFDNGNIVGIKEGKAHARAQYIRIF